ncbi:hypothetical protein [Marinobacterium litorale]|uniref:hypothetical protein n=1 Tax=Marinobacterium litorale TaxID=404770 RepID=UPI000424C60C|nr:hypothetical protein [Marinobacterium litorale]
MAVKPLTAAQKKVMASFARWFVYGEVEANVEGMKGFQKHMRKKDPECAQAEREFQKAVRRIREDFLKSMEKENGA